jgi:uncharacterized protein
MMLTWLGTGAPHIEGVRVVLGDRRMRATGALVSTVNVDEPAYTATYSLATGDDGVVSRVSVRAVTADGERQVTLNRSEEGIWLVDHGHGAKRTDFHGAVDVDVAACVLFNSIPVRRLGLHQKPGEHYLPVVYVALPGLSVQLVWQTYQSKPLAGDPQSVVCFRQDQFSADLTVDADGLVLDYPGLAKRV